MSQMISRAKELIRISLTSKQKIEYSTNEGRSWNMRYSSSACGDFMELTDAGREILATTSKGLYYSTNDGRNWNRRG